MCPLPFSHSPSSGGSCRCWDVLGSYVLGAVMCRWSGLHSSSPYGWWVGRFLARHWCHVFTFDTWCHRHGAVALFVSHLTPLRGNQGMTHHFILVFLQIQVGRHSLPSPEWVFGVWVVQLKHHMSPSFSLVDLANHHSYQGSRHVRSVGLPFYFFLLYSFWAWFTCYHLPFTVISHRDSYTHIMRF